MPFIVSHHLFLLMHIRQAFVLAGGKGERLRPLTDSLPKPLVKVAGRPILEYNVELLALHGVKEIVLATGYMHEKIREYFGDGSRFGVSIVYNIEEEPLGTGGALKEAEEMLSEKFFMLNGDNIADFNLAKMAEQHSQSGALATIALVEAEDITGYGVARLSGKKIVEFVEKPTKDSEPSKFVNAGAYIIDKKALEFLPRGFNLIEKTLFPVLASKGRLSAYIHHGIWFTTDTFERLEKAEKEVLENRKTHDA